MEIEELRKNTLGHASFWFPQFGRDDNSLIPMTYDNYTIKSFYTVCQNIEALESSNVIVNQGNTIIIGLGMLFISLESYINSIIKIACKFQNIDFKKYKKFSLTKRIALIFDMLCIPGKNKFYQTGIMPRLQEFSEFRNEIFHDRSLGNDLDFKKTSFCNLPFLANQVDLIQASSICFEIFSSFRYVYPGIDLMPNIFIKKGETAGYLKFDYLFTNVVVPMFFDTLKKHSLETKIKLPKSIYLLPETNIIKKGELKVILKATQDEKFNIKIDQNKTEICKSYFENAQKQINITDDEYFRIGNYYR
ncbi:hypothetical protein [uncultured Desulfosarcina sp.]|uniref:hypothetical protein n=1 Tax=uncultured Desulfosarcina sp. TaxID=218289 RepID=UPI0029C69C20|nr:hypothetical protein [uncultured Desulfosarcina sp.]